MLKLVCPECGGTHARKLSLIYEEGRSTGSGTMESVGTFNTIGRQQIHTKGTTTSSHQTDASRAAAPPPVPPFITDGHRKRTYLFLGGIVLGPAVGFLMYRYWADDAALLATAIITGVLTALGYAVSTAARPGEEAEFRRVNRAAFAAYDEWERTFACNSCGCRFVPGRA